MKSALFPDAKIRECGNPECRKFISKKAKLYSGKILLEKYSTKKLRYVFESKDALLCNKCYNNIRACVMCKRRMLLDYNYESISRFYCNECNDTRVIHECNIKNKPIYFNETGKPRQRTGKIYMGVELEVEANRGLPLGVLAHKIQGLFEEFIFLKWDGSINHGFEIVSQPATIEYHNKAWGKLFDLNHKGIFFQQNPSTCGMHVHVGRKMLECRHENLIKRLSNLIYNKENKFFLEYVACRRSNEYANYSREESRYGALNLSNKHTIEFRMFKGLFDKEAFLRNLESVKAMIDYCSYPGLLPKGSSSYKEFVKFIFANVKLYPKLFAHLNSGGFSIIESNEQLEKYKFTTAGFKKKLGLNGSNGPVEELVVNITDPVANAQFLVATMTTANSIVE